MKKMIMKSTLLAKLSLMALLALLLCNCQTTEYMTSDAERDAFYDAYKTWQAGVTTFDLMKKRYGEPMNRAELADGFAVRWLRTHHVVVPNVPSNYGNPVKSFERADRGPRSIVTVKSSLEAFFYPDGVLRNFRIKTIE